MKIVESILTKNPCYTAGRKITPGGLMLHSVGCPQPSATVFIKQWNPPANGRQVCVHGFIDANTGDVYQTLPWNHRGWHGGGSSNNTHIGVEMCEPNCIKYTSGSSFTCSDVEKARAMVKRTHDAAVELFAMLCKEFNLDPMADGVIISHAEGYKRGVASNHGDPEHLWNGLGMGYTMNTFRAAVKLAMGGDSSGGTVTPEQPATALYRVQVGAYTVREYAEDMLAKIKAAGFDAYMVLVDGLYKIQVGAFAKRSNAVAMLDKLKKAGFDGFITMKGGTAVSAAPVKEIKAGSLVRLKQGAKDYNGGNLASFVYERNHRVKSVNGNRVVITYNGVVIAAVRKDDLSLL